MKKGGFVEGFPYSDYPDSFPVAEISLQSLTEEEQNIIRDVNRETLDEWQINKDYPYLVRPLNQYGGEPYYVEFPPKSPSCPCCGSIMSFLCSIADIPEKGYVFSGNEYVQVIYWICKKCSVVTVVQVCD